MATAEFEALKSRSQELGARVPLITNFGEEGIYFRQELRSDVSPDNESYARHKPVSSTSMGGQTRTMASLP